MKSMRNLLERTFRMDHGADGGGSGWIYRTGFHGK
jgi:hypothetical protein